MDDLRRLIKKYFEDYLNEAKQKAISQIPASHFSVLNNLDFVVFEVPEHQFVQDVDHYNSETVLERLRKEFEDKFLSPLLEVAGKVGMLGNFKFFDLDEADRNKLGLPEIGHLALYKFNGAPRGNVGLLFRVRFEIGPERVGKEARFEYISKPQELKSIPDAFKEIVQALEKQGKMIPQI